MNRETFRKIQLTQLDILIEVDNLCNQFGIQYYMVGGTLLGAVRHKGFIPWDVDIDIAMPRKDYDSFEEICKDHLNPLYKYMSFRNTRNYTHPHALVCKEGTKLYSKYDKYNKHVHNYGVFIDIFPLDNTPDDLGQRSLHKQEVSFWRNFQANKISFSYSSNFLKRIIHWMIRLALQPFPLNWVNKRFNMALTKYELVSTNEIGAVGTGRFGYDKESMPREVFGIPVQLEFEKHTFFAPQNYEYWLKRMYGDYMKYPSKEQQEIGYQLYDEVVFNINDN